MGAQEYTLAEAPSLEVGSKQAVVFKPEDQDKYAPFSVPGSKLKSGTYNVVFLPYYKSIQRDFKVTGKLSKPLVSKAKNISTTEKHYFDLKLALARNFNALRKRSKAREVMEEMYRDFRPTKANPSFLLDLAIYRLQNKDFKGAISLFQKAEGYKRRFSASQRFIKFKRLYTLWSQAYEQLYYSTKNESFLRKSVQRLERLKPYARSKSPKVLKEIENKIKKLKGLGSSGKTQKEESMDLEDDF